MIVEKIKIWFMKQVLNRYMAVIELQQTQQKLNKFAAEQWDKTLAYLQGMFSLSRSDCEDIFQEAFIVLYKKITEGELTLTSKLSTYFIGICRNKAREKMRGKGKELKIIDETNENISIKNNIIKFTFDFFCHCIFT